MIIHNRHKQCWQFCKYADIWGFLEKVIFKEVVGKYMQYESM